MFTAHRAASSASRLVLKYAFATPAAVRQASTFPHKPSFIPFFTRSRIPYRIFSRRLLWALPIVGGAALYVSSRDSPLPAREVLSSPNFIPCPPSRSCEEDDAPLIVIGSPNEGKERYTVVERVLVFLREHLWEPVLTAQRFIHLFVIFIPVILSSPMLLVGDAGPRGKDPQWGELWWYDFLVASLERAGPTFIKLAQWAASRADLFSAELCVRMGRLHSKGKPHSIYHTRYVIERVFQRPFDEVFEEFNEDPIGVGAIAQVYRATLRKDIIPPSYLNPKRPRRHGPAALSPNLPFEPPPSAPSAAVAIKILHPRVAKNIERDLKIMRFFARFISLFPNMEWISLPEEVQVFGRMMAEQLNLRHEAENLRTFEQNFSRRKSAVTFPRSLMPFTCQDVLVEEYINALSMEAFLKNGGGLYDHVLAELGLDAFLNMLLLDNFVHSDLHPGNIMVKFYKPSTSHLLKEIWSSLIGTKRPEADPLQLPDNLFGDENKVINELRTYRGDPSTWRAKLDALHAEGYLPEIVFLDTGLVTTLNGKDRRDFLDLFRAIAEFDGYRAGQLMVERCRTPHLVVDPETFALRMQHLVLSVKRKTFSLGRIKISDILTEVLKAVREHRVKLEGDFVNTVISVLLLEGIGRQLDPELDLFNSALPILRQLGKQMTVIEHMESVKELPRSDLGAYLKLWVYLEARQFARAAIVNVDDLVRYDILMPNI